MAGTQAESIVAGLKATPPRLSHVYLYDDRGSELYEQITQTAEYYPTRVELALFREHSEDIATFPPETDSVTDAQTLCELGAGDGHKTMVLLTALAGKARETTYAPIDVSQGALEANRVAFERERFGEGGGAVRVRPFCGMYEDRLPEVRALPGTKTYMFLGSSLGNYSDSEGIELLALVRQQMGADDRFLLGVDTPHHASKPAALIHAAYNDAAGITAAFTLNALRHANRLAGLDFDWQRGWRHVAEYDEAAAAIITHVEAVGPQTVGQGAGAGAATVRAFAAGERIFVEQSRKFSLAAVGRLASASGLEVRRHWYAKDEWHIVVEMTLPRAGSMITGTP